MIDAYRRGYQAGSEESIQQSALICGAQSRAEDAALRVFAAMQKAGYAHIEPEEEFVRGFVDGVGLLFLSQKQPL